METERPLKRRRGSDAKTAGRNEIKRRHVGTTNSSSIGSSVDIPFWVPMVSLSKTKGEREDTSFTASPTKELGSRLERVAISHDTEPEEEIQMETENFRLPEEEDSSDDDSEDDTPSLMSAQLSLPVRYLDNFSILDSNACQRTMVALDDLEQDTDQNISPYFVGRVSARNATLQLDDDSDSEGEIHEVPSVLMRSSCIWTLWESEEPEEDGIVSEYSQIWIQTSYAWYILDRPSAEYRSFFLPRWLHHKLYILIIHLLSKTNANPTLSTFKKHFLRNEAKWALYEFGRELTLKDLADRMPEVLQTLTENTYDISERYFVEELYVEYAPHLAVYEGSTETRSSYGPSDSDSHTGSSVSDSPFRIHRKRYEERPPKPKSDPRLTPTFCTELVRTIAEPYFPSLRRRNYEDSVDSSSSCQTIPAFQSLPPPLSLPEASAPIKIQRSTGLRTNDLDWVKISGQKYKRGSTAFIAHQDTPEQVSQGSLQDSVWFGLITRLYCTPEGTLAAHVLWLLPAHHTSLNQLSHPQELVVIDECEEVDVRTFLGVCLSRKLGTKEREPEVDDSSGFFYRYLWFKRNATGDSFIDDAFVDAEYFLDSTSTDASHSFCPSCKSADEGRLASIAMRTQNGVAIKGIEYHVHDNVYVVPAQLGDVYIIGQITDIDCQNVTIRHLSRAPRPALQGEFYDDRVLRMDTVAQTIQYSVYRLEGKCQVLSPCNERPLIFQEDVFYLDQTSKLPLCSFCRQMVSEDCGTPLMGLDLFSGAGGFSMGLELTGCIKTGWAVEFDASAARTFSDVHPECVMFNNCLNRLLRHSESVQQAYDSVPLQSLHTQEDMPSFPGKGEVDIIFGGPPCQGFSRVNRCPRADDPRNRLILTFLSAIEKLEPKYVILENVRGLLTYRLGGQQMSMSQLEGGVPGGVVMLIKRVLMALNYQVRHGVLHASHYGSPQVRRRVIFIASRRGLSLPELPQPTHVASNHSLAVKVSANEEYSFTVSKRSNQAAPLGPVTVMDAIGDLPSWEWKNPHLICPPTAQTKIQALKRSRQVECIPTSQCSDPTLHVIGPRDPMPYGTSPSTFYQRWMRGTQREISQHYTPRFDVKMIERVCSVPLALSDSDSRSPDHNDLPEALKHKGREAKHYAGMFGRLRADGAFATVLGTLTPDTHGGHILHPNQHRTITIREFARAQGFPDSVKFQHISRNIKQITKQIGNAVPVPMAAAIGKEIAKVELRRRAKELEARAEREGSFEL